MPNPRFQQSFTDDPVAPSGTVTLRYELSNPNPGQILSDMTFIDNISAITGSTGISINTVPGTDPCGVSSSVALIFIDDDVFGVELTAGTLAASDSCSFNVTLDIDSDVAPADYVSTSGDVTATVSGNTVIASGASDTLQIEGGANLSFAKEFTETVLGAGQSTTLTFLLTSAPESPSTATGLTFTDDLSSFLAGATFSTNSDNCGGSPVLSAGDTLLTYSGGSLAPDASCTIDVTVTLPGSLTNGTYTNTTSTLTGTAGGESLVVSAASDDLQILTAEPLQLTKSFSPAEALPGEAVTLTYTLTNPDPTFAYAVSVFTESYSSALGSLAATSMPAGGFCGGSSTASGTTFGIFASLDIAAGDSCSFDVPLLVPVGAADGSYSSVTSSINATVDGNAVVLPAVGASFSVNSAQVELSKSYSDDTLAPGDTVTVDYVLTNLSSIQALSALAFTDNLDTQLSGLVATDTPIISTCGGGSSREPQRSVSRGTLAASASCTISVTQQVPGGASASIYSGTTSGVTGTASGLAITGPAVSAAFTVTSFELPSFSKSFSDPVLGAGGSTTLTYVITNNDGSTTLSGLRFSDDLDAALTGFSVTGGTGSNLCGTGSTVSGTSEILLEDGTLAPGDSCNIVLTVAVPAGATTGGYPGATSTLTENGEFAASAASATLTIEPAPGFSKDFASSSIVQGDVSTLTFTLDNSAASVAASSLDFTDNLPAGLTVASPANASTTCTGGTLTATTGTASISYTGGSAAAASCTVSADVRATSSGTLVNTSGDLTSFLGNSGTATATLSVSAAPVPGFAKAFSDDSIAQGGSTPLTFTIDNSAALMEASSLDFTDNLPTGLTVASPANASTTCTGGTLTATAGAASISYTGGSTAIGASCTVSADVTAATTGSLVNTSGDLTSSLGNSGTATATLKVPGLSLDSPIASDDVVNSAEAPAVTFSGSTTQIEDGETVSVTVTDSASATVSGSATVASDAWSLALDLSSLADGALTVTADAADASGSSAPQVSASFSKNTNTPSLAFDSPLAGDDIVSAAESATVTISGTSSGVPDGETVSVTVTDSASATVSGSTTAASDAWSLVLDLSSLAEGSLTVTADAADGAGNPVVQISTTLSHDLNPPTGYSASFDQDPVNNSNESAASFTFASAETGTSYAYTISSDGGGSDVTGSGTIASATDQITGIDLSGLGDGTLTLSVVLTDSANQAGTAATDTTTKNTDAPTVTLSGPTDAQSDPFTVDLTFGEAVTGLAASALIIDNGTASDLTGSGTSYSVTITPDHDGTVTLSLPAGSAQDSTGNGNLVSNEIEVIADLTGTPDPNPDPDADGDGIPDNLESSTADRDGDGIVDSADYDPQGYFYCEDDGRILSGGGITVTGPSGSNSSVGISNNINILRDGSTGEYQWFALVPGNYSVSYSYPSTGVASTARLSSGSLDVTSLLPANPAVLGSTEVGSTGVLADTSLSANPAFYDSFVIEVATPMCWPITFQ
ncbi:hypothetical protein EBB79_22225 (plasmid) [Parasedimentitalea marina]|uniref:Uncharacterized protein n=1 Tax=Parasedimentitalea marina TaxID=2483033 RepID=A0A3T0N9H0_9RHOB|nr:Ig-like domain-containing protein [Parasedimentitalea marina]AZV80673.1 hypothetical protein EBB79_22225 [Parasedimentitalea marina]